MKKNKLIPLFLSSFLLLSCGEVTSSSSQDLSLPSSSEQTSSSQEIETVAISEVRSAAADASLTTKGIVIAHNYTGQTTPYITGFWIADENDSIYIYGEDAAKSVEVGNEVIVSGTKAYYIPTNDQSSAATMNYKGMAQLTSPTILQNDKATHATPEGAINKTTVKDLAAAPLTTDISGKIYEVSCSYHKDPATGYTNYHVVDLNKIDRLNAYTQSNGKDFAWTDDYDNKTVNMLLITTLAKPGSSEWKFCPIKFKGEVTVTNDQEAEYGAYRALLEIDSEYGVDTTLTIPVEDPLTPGLNREYSSTSDLVTCNILNSDFIIKISASKQTTITTSVTVSYYESSKSAEKEVKIIGKPDIKTITVAAARTTADGEKVSVEAVVAAVTYKAGLVKQGLFLADATGSIFAYNGTATQANLAEVEQYNKVIVTGTIAHYIKNADNATAEGYDGDLQLSDVTVDFLDTNIYEIPAAAINEATVEEIAANGPTTNITGLIYKTTGTLKAGSYGSYSLLGLDNTAVSVPFYSQTSGSDSTFLADYAGKKISIIIGIQNLNLKSSGSFYRARPIAVLGEVA